MEPTVKLETPPMTEKADGAMVTVPSTCQTPAALEAQRNSSDLEREAEVDNYLHGWPLHALTLAWVIAIRLEMKLLADWCAPKALSGAFFGEPRSIDCEHFLGGHHEQPARIQSSQLDCYSLFAHLYRYKFWESLPDWRPMFMAA